MQIGLFLDPLKNVKRAPKWPLVDLVVPVTLYEMDKKTTKSKTPTVMDPTTSVLSIREIVQRPVNLSLDAKKAKGMVVMTPATASNHKVLKTYVEARCWENTPFTRTRKRYVPRQVDIEPMELMICANPLHSVAAVGVTEEDASGHWLTEICFKIIPTANTWKTVIARVSALKRKVYFFLSESACDSRDEPR